jgi:hypothetical protein
VVNHFRIGIEDRSPDAERKRLLSAYTTVFMASDVEANMVVRRAQYPPPPTQFAASPLVSILWERYLRHVDGREGIFTLAYFCKTMLEAESLGRTKEVFNISQSVLTLLGTLSTERGTASRDLRKHTSHARPATPAEEKWLRVLVLKLIHQAGVVASGAIPSKLTLNELPAL